MKDLRSGTKPRRSQTALAAALKPKPIPKKRTRLAGSDAARIYGESYTPPKTMRFKNRVPLDPNQVRDTRRPRDAAMFYGAFLGKPQRSPVAHNTIGGPVRFPTTLRVPKKKKKI